MDIRNFTSFAVTAELMNMTLAAERLNLTQSALSRQIMALETYLGVKLFEKAGRNIRLTSDGETLKTRIQDVVAAERELKSMAGGLSNGEAGLLRLGACSQIIERYFPTFLRNWQRANPGIELRLEDGGGAELLEKLRRGQVDMTLNAAPSQFSDGLEMRRIGSLGFLAIATTEHLEAAASPVDMSDLLDKPLLVLNRRHASREVVDAVIRLYGRQPNFVIESNSPHTLFSLAESGNGVAIVPSSVRAALPGLVRRTVTLKGEPIRFDLSAMWNRERMPAAYALRFVDELTAHIEAQEHHEAEIIRPKRMGGLVGRQN